MSRCAWHRKEARTCVRVCVCRRAVAFAQPVLGLCGGHVRPLNGQARSASFSSLLPCSHLPFPALPPSHFLPNLNQKTEQLTSAKQPLQGGSSLRSTSTFITRLLSHSPSLPSARTLPPPPLPIHRQTCATSPFRPPYSSLRCLHWAKVAAQRRWSLTRICTSR